MSRFIKKFVRQDDYVAEVDVELTDDPVGWGPYLSLSDANRLDAVRVALRQGDLSSASRLATIYRLTPIKATA
ncbi:MAG TPA: hypothetical protein VJZ71_19545 [Phycisphaerae bacterium]|nr:hypothetical protein [Phycisphaerae bacterium]